MCFAGLVAALGTGGHADNECVVLAQLEMFGMGIYHKSQPLRVTETMVIRW